MSETALQRRIQAAIKQLGGKVLKVSGGRFGRAGEPDLLGCAPGTCPHCGGVLARPVAFEVKRPDAPPPRPLQRERLREWSVAGALVGAPRSVDDALRIIRGE